MTALTPRQREIVHGLARGHNNRKIADELGIAERTVIATLTVIRHKLGVEKSKEIPARYRELTGDDPYLAKEAK